MRYVAFLAGINVGKRRIKMDRLRDLFESQGYANVETLIASGNVLFDSSERVVATLERQIEVQLRQTLGYEVNTFIRQPHEIVKMLSRKPFSNTDMQDSNHKVSVSFLRTAPPRSAASKLKSCHTSMDEFKLIGAELYWLCRGKTTESTAPWPDVARIVGGPSTMRNINTIARLTAMLPHVDR